MLGNGSIVSIASHGESTLVTGSKHLKLCNMLYVPQISKNLILVKRLCVDNKVVATFSLNTLCVKDVNNGNIMFF